MTDCLLCAIAAGAAERSLVYEDERCVVVTDLMPVNPGHSLVLPKRHAALVGELDRGTRAHLFEVGVSAAAALRRSTLRCDAVLFWLADGEAAGQEIPHAHLHVVPRYHGDRLRVSMAGGWTPPQDRRALDAAAARVREGWGQTP